MFSVWVCLASKLCLDCRLQPNVLNFNPGSPLSVITVQAPTTQACQCRPGCLVDCAVTASGFENISKPFSCWLIICSIHSSAGKSPHLNYSPSLLLFICLLQRPPKNISLCLLRLSLSSFPPAWSNDRASRRLHFRTKQRLLYLLCILRFHHFLKIMVFSLSTGRCLPAERELRFDWVWVSCGAEQHSTWIIHDLSDSLRVF